MPRSVRIKAFKYQELTDSAKQTARDNFEHDNTWKDRHRIEEIIISSNYEFTQKGEFLPVPDQKPKPETPTTF